jgi:hypothetical protein
MRHKGLLPQGPVCLRAPGFLSPQPPGVWSGSGPSASLRKRNVCERWFSIFVPAGRSAGFFVFAIVDSFSFVTRGLDPRVHPFREEMDCRVKPSNDAE